MPDTTTPQFVRQQLVNAGFNEPSVEKLMKVNPELALVAAEAKKIYDREHPGKSFQIEQGFRTKQAQAKIASLGPQFTLASGKKGQESPHQFGQAFDFHILEKNSKTGEMERQPDSREDSNDYVDVANAVKRAAQRLGYGNIQYGALGDVHVGRGRQRHNDWGHIEVQRSDWNKWHPGQNIQKPSMFLPQEKAQQQAPRPPYRQPPHKEPSLIDRITAPLYNSGILKPFTNPFKF